MKAHFKEVDLSHVYLLSIFSTLLLTIFFILVSMQSLFRIIFMNNCVHKFSKFPANQPKYNIINPSGKDLSNYQHSLSFIILSFLFKFFLSFFLPFFLSFFLYLFSHVRLSFQHQIYFHHLKTFYHNF